MTEGSVGWGLQILPGLVTLGVDPALDVRVKVAAAYGAVARYAGEEEAAGKVSNQVGDCKHSAVVHLDMLDNTIAIVRSKTTL